MTKQILNYSLIALSVIFLTASCTLNDSDDATPQGLESIEGKWRVTSFIMDGTEFMEEEIEEMIMEFGAAEDGQGQMLITIHEVSESTPEVSTGTYILDNVQKELVIFDALIDGRSTSSQLFFQTTDRITLSGELSSSLSFVMQAVRI